MRADPRVRCAVTHDVDALMGLCAEHAAFEHIPTEGARRSEDLRAALFDAPARLRAWVATVRDELVGYATVIECYSTLSGAAYLEMDCLFVKAGFRDCGAGSALFRAVCAHAVSRGLCEVRWQTPEWNTNAQRFYRRQGAVATMKARFSLRVACN